MVTNKGRGLKGDSHMRREKYFPEGYDEAVFAAIGLSLRGANFSELVRQGLPSEYLHRLAAMFRIELRLLSRSPCISSRTLG